MSETYETVCFYCGKRSATVPDCSHCGETLATLEESEEMARNWRSGITKEPLWRPVGLAEYELLVEADMKRWPPRLDHQPIFYPVLNREYAQQIARDWNTKDEVSGYIGIVTEFDIASVYVAQFERKVVGGGEHEELWIPAERLDEFNDHIVGEIRVVDVYYGEKYDGPKVRKHGTTA